MIATVMLASTLAIVIATSQTGSTASAATVGPLVTRMEIDGDKVTGAAPGFDWANIQSGTLPSGYVISPTTTSAGVVAQTYQIDGPSITQSCGVADANIVAGKLDDNPWTPATGSINTKNDLCSGGAALEVVDVNGQVHYILYQYYTRTPTATGDMSVITTLDGPLPGRCDDRVIDFDFNPSGTVLTTTVLGWTPTPNDNCANPAGPGTWELNPISVTTVDTASGPNPELPNGAGQTFGEFATDLTASGVLPQDRCVTFTTGTTLTYTGNDRSSSLKDIMAFSNPITINNCTGVSVAKVTEPAGIATTEAFTYKFDQVDGQLSHGTSLTATGGGVDTDGTAASITSTITSGQTHVWSNVIAEPDYRLAETSIPSPWALKNITCTFWDPFFRVGSAVVPQVRTTTTTLSPLSPIVVPPPLTKPAGQPDTACAITNTTSGVRVTKTGAGTAGTAFTFSRTGGANFPLTLNGAPATFAYTPASLVTITEALPSGIPAWSLASIVCTRLSNGSAVVPSAIDLGTRTVTVLTLPSDTVSCVFTNNQAGRIIVQKATTGDTGTFEFTGSGVSGGTGSITTTSSAGVASGTPLSLDVAPGAYTVAETPVAGWATASSCNDGSLVGSIDVAAGEIVTCTFTNTKRGSITIVKNTVGGDGTFSFSGTAVTGGSAAIITTSGSGSLSANSLVPGTYTVVETVPAGWDLTSTVCSDGSPITAIELAAGENITCTFTNVKRGSITVIKNTVGGNQSFNFTGTALPGGAAQIATTGTTTSGTGSSPAASLVPGTYNVAEIVPAGWDLTSTVCSDGSPITAIDLAAGENITCTFTNTKRGNITIIKNTIGGDGTFAIAGSAVPNSPATFTTVGGTFNLATTSFAPGLYVANETVPAGWDLTSTVCSDGSPITAIDLAAGENITCTFTNTKRGNITIIKNTNGGDGGPFAFTGTWTGAASFDISTTAGTGMSQFTNVAPGTYSVTETDPTTSFALQTLTCSETGGDGGSTPSTAARVATGTIDLDPGETVVCVYSNSRHGSITIIKDAVPNQPDDFAFTAAAPLNDFSLDDDGDGTLSNTITFSNLQASEVQNTTYSVTEAATPGWTLQSIECVNGTNTNVDRTATITVPAGAAVVCTFTNVATPASVTVTKTVSGVADTFPWSFGFTLAPDDADPSGTQAADGVGNGEDTVSWTGLTVGQTYTITEAPVAGWIQTLTCAAVTDTDEELDNHVTFVATAGLDLSCAATNAATPGTVELTKAVTGVAAQYSWSFDFGLTPLPAGQTNPKTISGTGNTTGNTVTWTALTPGERYTITETLVPGWISTVVCTGVTDLDSGVTHAVTFDATPGLELHCAATNTAVAPILRIDKTSTPVAGTFDFALSPAAITGLSIATAGSPTVGTTGPRTGITPGTPYTVTENDPGLAWIAGVLSCSVTHADGAISAEDATFTPAPGDVVVCSVTNTPRATIVIVKHAIGGTGTFVFAGTAAGSINTAITDRYTIVDVTPGSYTTVENNPSPLFDLTNLTCDDNNSTANVGTRTASIVADPGETVTCTFTNTKRGSITIIKDAQPDQADDFGFTGDLGAFTLDDDANAALSNTMTALDLVPGVYNVTESTKPGWTLASITCIDPNGNTTTVAPTAAITLDPGENITCTFVNMANPASLTINKTTVGGDGQFSFTADATTGSDIVIPVATTGLTGSGTSALVVGTTYTVSENDPGQTWTPGSISCDVVRSNGSTVLGVTTFTVQAGDAVTCSITNTKRATIIVVKNVEGSNDTFDFNGTFTAPNAFTIATAGTGNTGTGQRQFDNLEPAAYSLAEVAPTGYVGTLICSDSLGTGIATVVTGLSAAIALDPGETVTCTFTNTQQSTIIVDKQTVPSTDGVTVFPFALSGTAGFTLTNPQTAYNSGLLAPGTYMLTEQATSGWQLQDMTCVSATGFSQIDENAATANITLAAGDTVTCIYTNNQLGPVTVDKTVTAGPTLVSATTYEVSYDVVVTSDSFVPETFDLADAIDFGTGTSNIAATIDSAPVATVIGWTGLAPDTLLVDDGTISARSLAAPSTLTFGITVTFDVDPAMPSEARDCSIADATSTGTLNTATVTVRSIEAQDDACAPIPSPDIEIAKTVSAQPILDPVSGVWTIGYDLTISNTGQGPGSYDLTDTLGFGGDITVQAVTVAPVTVGLASDPAFNGGALTPSNTHVATAGIVAGGIHIYRVTVAATIVVTTGSGACTANPGSGFFNSASISVDGVSSTSNACAPFSTLTLDKTLINDNGGNATLSQFVLSATLGEDPAVISGADPSADPTIGMSAAVPVGSYELAETQIAGYLASTWTCSNGDAGSTVTVAAATNVTCTITNNDRPVDLTLTKSDGGATAIAGGPSFDYTITVDNGGSRDPDLSEPITVTDDVPAGMIIVAVPAPCTFNGQTVTCAIDPADLQVADPAIVLVVTVRLAADAPAGTYINLASITTVDDPACTGTGCVPTCESGSNNVDCEPTPGDRQATITVTKSDDVATAVHPGNTYAYTIAVTNNGPSTVTDVTITDDLPAGLTLVSATGTGWACNATDPITCTSGGVLQPGAIANPVTVTVRLDVDFVGTSIHNVAIGTATVEPGETTTDDDDETTPVVIQADLAIVKVNDNPSPASGTSFAWILTVTNHGPDPAHDITITDNLPATVAIVAAASGDFACNVAGNTVTCTRASLASGASGVITITVTVDPAVSGQDLVNTASVTSPTPDPDLGNNTDDDTVVVPAAIVLPPTPTVPPIPTIPPAPVTLPVTGTSDSGRFLSLGLGLLMAGASMVVGVRRRRGAARSEPN